MHLQRTAGNCAVAGLLSTSRPPEVQRAVLDYRLKAMKTDQAERYVGEKWHDLYEGWLRMGETPESIKAKIAGHVESAVDIGIYDLPKVLTQQIKEARFAPTVGEPGPDTITAQVWRTAENFPGGLTKEIVAGGVSRIETAMVHVEAEVAIDGTPSAIANWEVGFLQTILTLHRSHTLAGVTDLTQSTTTLAGPTRDGPSGYAGPWFDDRSRASFTRPKQPVTVVLDDKPGTKWTQPANGVGANLAGGETFKTWLVLRHRGDGRVRYLHMWNWKVDYGGAGVTLLATGQDNGSQAALAGPVGKDAFIQTPWKTVSLPSRREYETMKKLATRKITLGSGMMPTATYGSWVAQCQGHLATGRYAGALVVLTQIKDGLDKMDGAGKEYWRTPELKAQYFQPIRDDVMTMVGFVKDMG